MLKLLARTLALTLLHATLCLCAGSAAAAKRPVAKGTVPGSRDLLQEKNVLGSSSSSSSSFYSTSGLQSRVESLSEGLT
jgi:hypothetical protein